jgi:hypothetical protein
VESRRLSSSPCRKYWNRMKVVDIDKRASLLDCRRKKVFIELALVGACAVQITAFFWWDNLFAFPELFKQTCGKLERFYYQKLLI